MRLILLITANLVLIATLILGDGGLFWDSNKISIYYQKAKLEYTQITDSYLYKKDINISGNSRLSKKELTNLLPVDKSIAWWMLNKNSVESVLLLNSLVEAAEVSVCSYTQWGCFNVKIKERKPEYIALLGDEPWLIGSDGGFISPLNNLINKKSGIKIAADELAKSVMIKGLLEKDYSPDVLQAKISFLSQAISTIEKKLKLKITEAEVNSDSEIAVKFLGKDFTARFNFAEASLVKIEDQSIRLKKILNEYAGRLEEVTEIDLAFDHIAVVKKAELKKS